MHDDGHILVVTAPEDDPEWLQYAIKCPHPIEKRYQVCAEWNSCGCTAEDIDAILDLEDRPCPTSPTKEHRYFGELGDLCSPTTRCFVQGNDYLPDAASEVARQPGEYRIAWDVEDQTELLLELAEEKV